MRGTPWPVKKQPTLRFIVSTRPDDGTDGDDWKAQLVRRGRDQAEADAERFRSEGFAVRIAVTTFHK